MKGQRVIWRGLAVVPRVLTVAGSDSGGGAGIQADLKTIALLGGYGMSAVTALTAQNTLGVKGIFEVPADFIGQQMEAVISDIGVDALKTGMLSNPEVIRAVCQKVRKHRILKVVVDPVMVAKNGTRLLSREAEGVLKEELLPLAQVITPNLPESEALTGGKIRGLRGMHRAAVRIQKMGARNVLIKGGHLSGNPVDVFFDGKKFYDLQGVRISTPHTHGTGCTISAAIATELAKGSPALEAVEKAKAFVTSAIQFSLPLGRGQGPVNPYGYLAREIERYRVIRGLKGAFQNLQKRQIGDFLPEVGSNLGYALPYARGVEDIAAFPGRIVPVGKEIFKVADPEFGASLPIAAIILTAMAHDPDMRSAMNLRFSEEILDRVKKARFILGHFGRKQEPIQVKRPEGYLFSWEVDQVLQKLKKIPDIIFDRGDVGKEPMVRVLGHDPEEVASKVFHLL
jgi:hydroxymethylpyrimidine kinase/phosphomethylpyrimidine kinase